MNEKILNLKLQLEKDLSAAEDMSALENIRVSYLGKKGSITELLKNMKDLSNEEKKTFGQEVNVLKTEATEQISQKLEELKEAEIKKEIESMPVFDISMPANLERGSYQIGRAHV